MRLRVDFEARTVAASVRDLVAPATSARDIGLWQQLRARLGQQVHHNYRSRRARDEPAFRAECCVEMVRVIDEFCVRVRGRADGVITEPSGLVVEEVKSMLMAGSALSATRLEHHPHYCDQLQLYALALSEQHPERIVRPRLVLGSVVDGAWHEIDVDFDKGAAERLLRARVRAGIARAEAAMTRCAERKAKAAAVAFPYAAKRPHQSQLIDAVEDGLRRDRPVLAMAPTGIGKTVSALVPALRCALEQDTSVYFATSRTTQQALVARTFSDVVAATGADGHRLRAVTLRAKQRMCPPGDMACHPDLCDYLRAFDRRVEPVLRSLIEGGGHLSPDDISAAGCAARLCPFELSLAVAAEADVVIGDYNYVFDRAPGQSSADARTRIVIVDEAHSLFDRARSYDSPFLSRASLVEVAAQLQGSATQLTLPGAGGPFAQAAHVMDEVISAIDVAVVAAAEALDQAADHCVRLDAGEPSWSELASTAEAALIRYVIHKRTHRIVRPRDPVVAELRRVIRIHELIASGDPAMVPYVSGPGARAGTGVGVLCVDPSRRLAACHARAKGTVAMSATLNPLPYYVDVLGFRDMHPLALTVPSPFPREHCRVAVVPSVATTYKQRYEHLGRIATLINDIVGVRPGNYIAFFSSFAFLDAVRRRLPASAGGHLLAQAPNMTGAQRDAVLTNLRTAGRPTLLLAVLGGIFAEGIDLPGEALVGAIVVGPGLPPFGFEREAMRSYLEDTYGDGFAYALLYPGMQRVVQSAGRVIRTMTDRGVVALIGRRFGSSPYSDCLPHEWHDGSVIDIVEPDPVAAFKDFWASNRRDS